MADKDTTSYPNMYRRNFNWRVSHGQPMSNAEALGMTYVATNDYPDILEDFLLLSRRRQRNRTALAKLQMQILSELANTEHAVKHYKSKLEIVGKQRPFVEAEIFRYRMIANALRIIGDGIAWRALRFDRIIPRILSTHPVKHVISERGMEAEVNEFQNINRTDSIPLFNAITNCLAIGDITVVAPDDSVEIVEVKSSNTSDRRKTRQKVKLRETVQFLDDGGGPIEGRNVAIERLPIAPQNYLVKLHQLLKESEDKGWSSGVMGSHCFVECVDFGHPEELGPKMEHMEAQQKELLSQWRDDRLTEMDSQSIITFAPNLAPFSVYPFPDRTCVELMIGSKYFRSILNITAVAREFERNGWRVEAQMEEALKRTNKLGIMVMSKGNFECHLPPGDFGKLQFEMLNPSTLVEECEIIRGRGPSEKGQFANWAYAGEADQWK